MENEFWTDYSKRRAGKGNPYYACTGCGRTDPQINGNIENHGEGCSEVGRYLAEKKNAEYDLLMSTVTIAKAHECKTRANLRGAMQRAGFDAKEIDRGIELWNALGEAPLE